MSRQSLRTRLLAAAIALTLTTPAVSTQVSDDRSAQGHSPLNQISGRNVHRLQLVSDPPPPPLPAAPGESDGTLERILVDDNGRSSVFSMSPAGILWEHDRRTGAYRAAYDLGYQNTVTLDPLTGAVIQRSQAVARGSTRPLSCPGPAGFKSRRAMAFHPGTHALYVPLTLHCMEDGHYQFHPSWPEGLGEFVALDVRTRRVLWRHRTRAPLTSAALTTGGGLVIVGDADGNLYIHDIANGKILYRTRLPNAVGGVPVTYAVRGRQYLAVSTIAGDAAGWADVARALRPEAKFTADATGVHVFALPEGTQ